MSITRVQLASATSGANQTSSPAASWPAPTTLGNLLVAIVCVQGNPGINTVPAGWTPVFAGVVVNAAADTEFQVWYIPDAASRSGAETFGLSAVKCWSVTLIEYAGADAAAPLDQTASNPDTAGTAQASWATGTTPATSAPAVAGASVQLAVWAARNSTTFSAYTNGFVEIVDAATTNATGTSNISTGVAELVTSGGAAASSSATLGTSRVVNAGIVAFKAPSGGGSSLAVGVARARGARLAMRARRG